MRANVAELARAERNRYTREWRAKNKEKVREYNRRHWEKVALERLERKKEADHERE